MTDPRWNSSPKHLTSFPAMGPQAVPPASCEDGGQHHRRRFAEGPMLKEDFVELRTCWTQGDIQYIYQCWYRLWCFWWYTYPIYIYIWIIMDWLIFVWYTDINYMDELSVGCWTLVGGRVGCWIRLFVRKLPKHIVQLTCNYTTTRPNNSGTTVFGWWFGTFLNFSYIGISSSQLTHIFEGGGSTTSVLGFSHWLFGWTDCPWIPVATRDYI